MSAIRLSLRPSAALKRHAIRSSGSKISSLRYYSESKTIDAQSMIFTKFGEPQDVLRVENHTIPSVAPTNGLVLRTLAAPVNPADINTIQGLYGSLPEFNPRPFGPWSKEIAPAAIPGNEGVFEVLDSASSAFEEGDWVIPLTSGFGTWRTHAITGADNVWKVPKHIINMGLTPQQAAVVSVNPMTALRLISDFGNLKAGDWLIQNAANSAVGRMVIQLARLKGIRTINIIRERPIEGQTFSLELELRNLGADLVVTDKTSPRDIRAALPEDARVSLALNCVGGKETINMARVLADGSDVVTYGAMGKRPIPLGAGLLIFKDISFKGFWVSRWGLQHIHEKFKAIEELLELMAQGKLKEGPSIAMKWGWGDSLGLIQQTLDGYSRGKPVFVWPNTGLRQPRQT